MRIKHGVHAIIEELIVYVITVSASTPAIAPRSLSQHLTSGAVVAAFIFAAALFGIMTRPSGFLASLWPANAILVALMVRHRHLAGFAGWAGAVLGYITADLITGGGIALTLWLTIANLANAAVCVWLFQRVAVEDRELRRPSAIARLLMICVCGAIAAAVVGCGVLVNFFGASPLRGFASYFVTELGSNLMVLPMALSAPSCNNISRRYRRASDARSSFSLRAMLPAMALLASLLIGEAIDGPGKLVISVPAIIWCALSYQLFTTASLMFVVGLWHCVQLPTGMNSGQSEFYHSIVSFRLALALLALGPMSIALTNSAHAELISTLSRAASQDTLTSALSRGAFLERAGQQLAKKTADALLPAVLMIDVDHFKDTNDRFGHAAGDDVLTAIGETVTQLMRQDDLFGRLGGEEFAVFLPEIARDNAMIVAERIRLACERIVRTTDDGQAIGVSISIGVACAADTGHDLGELLKAADQALYAAKRAGRNRVMGAG